MSKEHFGAVNTPVYRASTILFPDLAGAEGRASSPIPMAGAARPASQSLEDAIAEPGRRARTVVLSRRA